MTDNTKATIVEQSALQHMADLFKVLGDPTRMRILFLISDEEACVSKIADVLQIKGNEWKAVASYKC